MKHLKVKFVKNVFLCLKVPMATHMGTESNGFDVRFPSNLFNVTFPPPPRGIRKLKHVSPSLMLMAGSKFKKDAKKSPPQHFRSLSPVPYQSVFALHPAKAIYPLNEMT